MSNRIQRPHLRPRLARFVLLGIMALAAAGLTQCRLMDDPVTGIDVRGNTSYDKKNSKCVHRCEKGYKRCNKKESEQTLCFEVACQVVRRLCASITWCVYACLFRSGV